jgi:RNA polymerase sigma-32 factor
LANPWNVIPPLGNIDAYITAVNRIPMLTHEEELHLAKQLKEEASIEAAGKLIMSHLRLVVSLSRQYLGYGLPQADLIQEGNIGLMKAVKRFDPAQNVRLVSYAMHWIKAEIHEYIIRNWRMVKIASTKAQRKLFFNLRSLKLSLKSESGTNSHQATLSQKEIDQMATKLGVKPEEVIEMETRLSGADIALDPIPQSDEDEALTPIAYLADTENEPSAVLAARERAALSQEGIGKALALLDERSRRIVEERWLKVNDDGTGGMTLHELAEEYGVSAERVRQIEFAAMKKMRATLSAN